MKIKKIAETIEDKVSGAISIFVFVALLVASGVGFFIYNIPVLKAVIKGILSLISG